MENIVAEAKALSGWRDAFADAKKTALAVSKILWDMHTAVEKIEKVTRESTRRRLADFDKIQRISPDILSKQEFEENQQIQILEQYKDASAALYETLQGYLQRYAGAIQLVGESMQTAFSGGVPHFLLTLGGTFTALANNVDLLTVKTTLWQTACQKALGAVTALGSGTSVMELLSGAVTSAGEKLAAFTAKWAGVSTTSQQTWDSVEDVWGGAGQWFTDQLSAPMGTGFQTAVNGVIAFVNKMLSSVTAGINAVMGVVGKLSIKVPDWVPLIGGKTLGYQLKALTAPQIPYLAKGAVLPANKPFLAMVGDQKHGTNVEAPLSTIADAVAKVTGAQAEGLLAGLEASVSVQREILQAVLGISIGDEVIASAADSYRRKMAVVTGGAL